MERPFWIINSIDQTLTLKLGRRVGSGDPDFESLRRAAQLVIRDKLNPSAAIKKATGKNDGEVRYYLDLWRKYGPALCAGADCYSDISSYDPKVHAKAEVGTRAWVNSRTVRWREACQAGWNPVHGFGHGEMLIRRDLAVSIAKKEKKPEHVHDLIGHFREIGYLPHKETR